MADQDILNNKTILSFQPFSIFTSGGGPRIIRRLIEERQKNVMFLSLNDSPNYKNQFNDREILCTMRPLHRKWMRSFIRNFSFFVRDKLLYSYNEKTIRAEASKLNFDILHVIHHHKYANSLTQFALKKNIPIWVSFHDHFRSVGCSENNSRDLWKFATKRMVISKELGDHYCQLFGYQPYIVVTDGLKEAEISSSKPQINSAKINIYFGGVLHYEYYPVLKSFFNALDILSKQEGVKISVVLRGTQKVDFMDNCHFDVELRKATLDNEILKQEMNEADILYLPMKYTDEYFYKYSFSTKMIGYLGASGNIFYHGPKEAAAAKFLENNNCGVICDSLDTDMIIEKLRIVIGSNAFSLAAKKVAYEQFLLKNMQQLFMS